MSNPRSYGHAEPLLLSDLLSSFSTDKEALAYILTRYNDLVTRHRTVVEEKRVLEDAASISTTAPNGNDAAKRSLEVDPIGDGASSRTSTRPSGTARRSTGDEEQRRHETSMSDSTAASVGSSFQGGAEGLGLPSNTVRAPDTSMGPPEPGGPSSASSPYHQRWRSLSERSSSNDVITAFPNQTDDFGDRDWSASYHHANRSMPSVASSLRTQVATPPPNFPLPQRPRAEQSAFASELRKSLSLDLRDLKLVDVVSHASQQTKANRFDDGRAAVRPSKTPPPPIITRPHSSNTNHDDRHQLLGDSRYEGLSVSASVPVNLASLSMHSTLESNRRGGRGIASLLPPIAPGSPLYSNAFTSRDHERDGGTSSTDGSVIDPSERYAYARAAPRTRAQPANLSYGDLVSPKGREDGQYRDRDQLMLPSAAEQKRSNRERLVSDAPLPAVPYARSSYNNGDEPLSPQGSLISARSNGSNKISSAQAYAMGATSSSSTSDGLPSPNPESHSNTGGRWSQGDDHSAATMATSTSSYLPLPSRPRNYSTHSVSTLDSSAPSSPQLAPLVPAHLPHIRVRINSSRLRASDNGKEVVVFSIDVHVLRPPLEGAEPLPPIPQMPRWTIEKTIADIRNLDSAMRSKASRKEAAAMAPLPDKSLFKDHAPVKQDQRRTLSERHLQTLVQIPFNDRSAICAFLTCDVAADPSTPNMPLSAQSNRSGKSSVISNTASASNNLIGLMEGYLTKRGRHLGGWQTRYYIVNPGVALMYYDTPGGLKIGEIPLANAAVGRQAPSSRKVDNDYDAYLHAFLIRAIYDKEGEQEHILCAETDEIRDQWVQALTAPPTTHRMATPANTTPVKSQPPIPNHRSMTTISEGADRPPLPTTPNKGKISAPVSESALRSMDPDHQLAAPASTSKPNDARSRVGQLTFESFRRPESAQENHRPALLTRRSAKDRAMSDDVHKHDSTSSASANGGGGRHSVSDVSSPMNATPLPNGYDFKGGSKDAAKIERRKTKSFWGGFSRVDKNSDAKTSAPQPVFGVPLREAVAQSRIRPGLELPAVMYRCVEYLEAKHAETEEGIFRLSGSANVIRLLKDRFDTEGDVNLLATKEYVDPHAIAGLLKLYLRELPGHLLTRELHYEFLQVIDLRNRKDRVNLLGSLIARLPIEEYTLFRFLFAYLFVIAQSADVNKMNLRNLSIVFSPSLSIPAPLFILILSEFDLVFAIEPESGLADPTMLEDDPDPEGRIERRRKNRNSELYLASGAPLLMEQEALRQPLRDLDFGEILPVDTEWFAESGLGSDSAQLVSTSHTHTQSQTADAFQLLAPTPNQYSHQHQYQSQYQYQSPSTQGHGQNGSPVRNLTPNGLPTSPGPRYGQPF
ncbi:BQ2448_119 [Microbotryum intermedium]|uniref:BQ2448_119 protein n=1 Tax=Microbotryum intermedium TaxID=269621 RepID=A0A238FA48_9BASI|nr:BQ2448_119 [Microbotryum intermedium]